MRALGTAAGAQERLKTADFVIYGHAQSLSEAAIGLGIDPFWWRVRRVAVESAHLSGQPVLLVDGTPRELDIPEQELEQAAVTRAPTKVGGAASYAWVEDAIADALTKTQVDPAGGTRTGSLTFGTGIETDAIVTAPINKAAWSLAGIKRFPGHTELLAERTAAKRARMMFVLEELRVILATTHIPLSQVTSEITIGRVAETIDLAYETARQLGTDSPTIAVAGINPHAGENGLMGDEEERIITPAIKLARSQGKVVTGPHPGDTVFRHAIDGHADIVVAMYHDQALAPVKTIGFDRAVNLTTGLPIIRTSPDHGTAYNIAGSSTAHPGSMSAAIDLAISMARRALASAPEHAQ